MLRNPVTIWVVRVDEDVYIRSVNGRDSSWFRGAQVRQEGHIRAGVVEIEVAFIEESGPGINDQIDDPYRVKYQRYAANIVNSVLTPEAGSATLKLIPHAS